jgi:hypothetical protein
MLFKKVCPRCKRRYPKNFTSCLECGSPLIDTDREAKKAELKKYLPLAGMILLCGLILAAVLFFVLPLVQYSLSSGQEFGTLSKTQDKTSKIDTYLVNQPASDNNLRVTMTKTRDGAMSANSKKFFFVTVELRNLRTDQPIRVNAGDFTLLDAGGNPYPSYGLGDKIAQEIDPLSTESYELNYEIPADARDLKVQYRFADSSDRSGQMVYFLL